MNPSEPTDARAAQLRDSLAALESRIVTACRRAGRERSDVTLIAVTKTYPAADLALLAGLGIRDVGENRVDELLDKHGRLGAAVTWHFVGRIQSRQARSVATHSDVVHSVDRPAVAERLSRFAVAAGRRLDAFVQLSLDGDPARGGAPAGDLPRLADLVAAAPGLRLAGVMAVPPLGAEPAAAYARLVVVAEQVRRSHPGADGLSAGMSDDLEPAVAAGATHLRIGTALLGRRPAPVG